MAEQDLPQLSESPSTPSQGNFPLFGSLNAREPLFYIHATEQMLKTILSSAPSHLRSPLLADVDRDILISEVLLLRHEEAVHMHIDTNSPEVHLEKLLSMNDELLRSMAYYNSSTLRALMRAALQADLTIQPRVLSTSCDALIITVLTWQVHSKSSAQASASVVRS